MGPKTKNVFECVIMVAEEIKPLVFLFIQHTLWVGEVQIDCANLVYLYLNVLGSCEKTIIVF